MLLRSREAVMMSYLDGWAESVSRVFNFQELCWQGSGARQFEFKQISFSLFFPLLNRCSEVIATSFFYRWEQQPIWSSGSICQCSCCDFTVVFASKITYQALKYRQIRKPSLLTANALTTCAIEVKLHFSFILSVMVQSWEENTWVVVNTQTGCFKQRVLLLIGTIMM